MVAQPSTHVQQVGEEVRRSSGVCERGIRFSLLHRASPVLAIVAACVIGAEAAAGGARSLSQPVILRNVPGPLGSQLGRRGGLYGSQSEAQVVRLLRLRGGEAASGQTVDLAALRAGILAAAEAQKEVTIDAEGTWKCLGPERIVS